jgi:hypothetical protein
MNCRLIYKNLIRTATVLATSTEHPQFPVEYCQDDSPTFFLRSRYGSINSIASGNGRFVVATGVNKKINFDEGGAELTATLTPGTYNGQTLAVEVQTQLEVAGALSYTVTYDETTGKFTIAASGNFTLRWNTGTDKAIDASGLLGFSDAADDTGTDTYTSDTVVIHTKEAYDFDLGVATEYDSIALLNHNLTSSAVIKVYGADDSAFTSNVVTDTLTHNDVNLYEFLGTARTKRYVRLEIEDVANPSMFIQVGVFVVGKYLQTNVYFGPYADGPLDENEIEYSPAKVALTTSETPVLDNWEIAFTALNDATASGIKLLLAECGVRRGFWFCTNEAAANTASHWVRLKEAILPRREQYNYWTWEMPIEERL